MPVYLQYGHIAGIDEILEGKKPITDLGVKAIDDHTLEVTLSEPVPYFYKITCSPINFTGAKSRYREIRRKMDPAW